MTCSAKAGIVLSAALLFFTGCSGNLATVTGKVTLDGKPLTKGDIAFYSSAAALAMGSIDERGNYSLRTGTSTGLTPGTYQVTVVANDIIAPTQPLASPMPKLLTPPKYSSASTSGLSAEVKVGSNTHNFNLVSVP